MVSHERIYQYVLEDKRNGGDRHKAIAEALGVDYYFAHPYHSWERGANENMTGSSDSTCPKEPLLRISQTIIFD